MESQKDFLRRWKVRGNSRSSGGTFDKVSVLGEAEATSNLKCRKMRVLGTLSVQGNLETGKASILGVMNVSGNVVGEKIRLMGEFNIKGDCSAESVKSRGAMNIEGLLNAGRIDVRLHGPWNVKEIGGGVIHVKLPSRVFAGGGGRLCADTIEGDEIRLENTSARMVRGNSVFVGTGCTIDCVEYRTKLRVTGNATVTEKVQS